MKLVVALLFLTSFIHSMEKEFPEHLPRPPYSRNNDCRISLYRDPAIKFGKKTPLHEAAFTGNVEKVTQLLRQTPMNIRGDLVNARNEFSQTPLHLIAERADISKNHLMVAILMITAGAHVNAKESFGSTPLHKAALNNYSCDFIKLLIAAGADINAKNILGNTPLHETSRTVDLLTPEFENARARSAELLLAHKARIDEKNEIGKTPVDFATEDFHIPVLITYIKHGIQFADVIYKVDREFWPYLAYRLHDQSAFMQTHKVGALWVNGMMRNYVLEK